MENLKLLVGSSGGSPFLGGKAGSSSPFAALNNPYGLSELPEWFPSLSLKQRLTGCVVCFAAGMLISLCSTLTMADAPTFGMLYSIGNLLSLCSTALLFGPWRQVQNMFARKRAVATLMYLASLGGTIAVAILTEQAIPTLGMMGVQFCCLVWYTLSYIPFGRDALKRALLVCCGGGGKS